MPKNKLLKKEKGAIILMFIMFLPFMLAFVGLAIDFGLVYSTKTKMQNTADAAALAGVVHMHKNNLNAYVQAMLTGNSFEPSGNGDSDVLNNGNNWKLGYQRTATDAAGNTQIIELTGPDNATRLRVTIFRETQLFFIPIFAPNLRTINLETTAVAQGTIEKPPVVDYQIITLGTLTLGSYKDPADSEKLNSGDVHIPSYPESYKTNGKAKDLYSYNDWGEDMPRHVVAKTLNIKKDSTMRLAGKLVTESVDASEHNKTIFMPNNDYSNHISGDFSSGEFYDKVVDEFYKGIIKGVKIKNKEEKPALIIEVNQTTDGGTVSINDFYIAGLISKNGDCFEGLDIIAPVLIRNSKSDIRFTISMNISFYSFREPVIIENGNIEISGSKQPTDHQDADNNTRKYQTYNSIYCYNFSFDNITDISKVQNIISFPNWPKLTGEALETELKYAGNVSIASGSAAVKNLEGIMYGNSSIWISSAKDYRRHIFCNTLISPGDITFAADHSSYAVKPATNKFTSVDSAIKISLVE